MSDVRSASGAGDRPATAELQLHSIDVRETVKGSRCANTPTPPDQPVRRRSDMADATSRTVPQSQRQHGEKGWGSSYSSPGPDAFYARCRCGEKFYGRTPKVAINRRQRHIDKAAGHG